MSRSAACLALGVLLTGCAHTFSPSPAGDAGPFPKNYGQLVSRQLRIEFPGAASLREVWIAAPYKARMLGSDGWMVCLRADGKNRAGDYTGRQGIGYLIYQGRIVQKGDHTDCPYQHYTEWKAMEDAPLRP